MWRFLLRFLLILALLATVASGTGWYLLHDEAFVKARLKSASLKYTGRELLLNGPLTLDPGRVTTLEASNIQFANADWAGQPHMVVIGHLKISLDLPSLLSDWPVFPSLSLRDCNIELFENDQGQANWDLADYWKSDSETGKEPRRNLPVRLNELEVENCELVLTSPTLEKPLDFKTSRLSMKQHDDNRWEGAGSGSINDEVLSFDGWLNPFSALFLGGPLTHDLTASLGKNTMKSSGSVQDALNWTGANVTTRLQGPDIANILDEFNLPSFSEGAFDFQLKLNTEGDMTRVDLTGDLGSLNASAKGELDQLRKPTKGDIRFSVDGPNLGALAKVFGVEGLVEEAFSHESHATFEPDKVQLDKATMKTGLDQLEVDGHFNTGPHFSGTDLKIHFHSDEAGRWTPLIGHPPMAVGPLDFDGNVSSDANGLFSIKATASQNSTSLDIEGTIGQMPDRFHPELNIIFASKDPSGLAAIAGLESFPSSPLSIKGHIGMKDRRIELGNVQIDLGGDRADINGLLNLEDHYAGTDLTIDLDIRNTAKLGQLFGRDGLPDQPLKMAATVQPAGEGLAFQVNDGNLGQIQLELDGKIPDLQKPLFMEGDFDIGLPRLSDISFLLPGQTLPDSPFSAKGKLTTQDRQLKLENINVNLGGSRASITGLLNLENRYAGSDLNIQLYISNAGELARSFGRTGFPEQPLQLDAEVKPDGKGMAFTVKDGNLGDLQLELQGQITDMAKPLGLNAQFDILLPRLSEVSFLLPGRELPDVPFRASGRLINQQTQTRLDQVQVEIGKVSATIDGALFPEGSFKLSVDAQGPDVSGLAKVFGQTLKPEPFSLSADAEGKPSEFDLSNLAVTLGSSRASGNLKFIRGATTRISGKVDSPYLDISQWIVEREKTEKAEAKTRPERKWVFDDKPVMSIVDLWAELDLDINIAVIQLQSTLLTDLTLGLTLSNDLMEMNPFHFKGERGGSFRGETRLDDRGSIPLFHLNMHGNDLRLGLSAIPGQDSATIPPIEFDLLFDGSGQTRREMASSLNGKLRAYWGSGQVAEAGISLLFSDFFTELFTLLNPFAKSSEYTTLDCGVVAAEAVSGELNVFPVIFHTEQLTILSQGTIDLNTEKIDMSFNTKPRKGLGLSAGVLINPLIKVGGTLAAPAMELDPAGTVKSTGLAVATVGISLLAKSMSDRFLSSTDPCGDARKEIEKRDSAGN